MSVFALALFIAPNKQPYTVSASLDCPPLSLACKTDLAAKWSVVAEGGVEAAVYPRILPEVLWVAIQSRK